MSLHDKIMNIPAAYGPPSFVLGFSTAQSLSAELAVEADAQIAALQAECEALRAAIGYFLNKQDALDNHELMGSNAHDYFTLLRRRNESRRDLDAAIDNERSKA